MRPRYYIHMFEDKLSGLFGHRSGELVNRYPVMGKIVRLTKREQQASARRAVSVRLGKAFLGKLAGLGMK